MRSGHGSSGLQQRDVELTERQRQVLRLIAAGKTNAEIGSALGISLDGAKWHVSEILAKLEVGSREEAAEWWNRRERPAAKLARAVRAAGLSLGWKFVVGGAGLAAVAGAFAFVAWLHAGSSSLPGDAAETAAITPATVLVAYAALPDIARATQDLIVIDATNKSQRTIASSSRGWVSIAWSPDGRFLASVEAGGPDGKLHLFTRSDWSERTLSLRQAAPNFAPLISWAPDGSKFALLTKPFVEYRTDLTEVARFDGPFGSGRGGSAVGWWSPDSQVVVAIVDGTVALWPDGTGGVVDAPDWPAGWKDPKTLVVGNNSGVAYLGTLSGKQFSWKQVAQAPATSPAYESAMSRLAALQPNQSLHPAITADGRGVVQQATDLSTDTSRAFNVDILFADAVTHVDIPAPQILFRLPLVHWDVVVVGGTSPLISYTSLP